MFKWWMGGCSAAFSCFFGVSTVFFLFEVDGGRRQGARQKGFAFPGKRLIILSYLCDWMWPQGFWALCIPCKQDAFAWLILTLCGMRQPISQLTLLCGVGTLPRGALEHGSLRKLGLNLCLKKCSPFFFDGETHFKAFLIMVFSAPVAPIPWCSPSVRLPGPRPSWRF